MYLGLMTTLHTLYSFDIYDDVCFSPLSHMCCFFSLFILFFFFGLFSLYFCFLVHITSLYFTLDALMDLAQVF